MSSSKGRTSTKATTAADTTDELAAAQSQFEGEPVTDYETAVEKGYLGGPVDPTDFTVAAAAKAGAEASE